MLHFSANPNKITMTWLWLRLRLGTSVDRELQKENGWKACSQIIWPCYSFFLSTLCSSKCKTTLSIGILWATRWLALCGLFHLMLQTVLGLYVILSPMIPLPFKNRKAIRYFFGGVVVKFIPITHLFYLSFLWSALTIAFTGPNRSHTGRSNHYSLICTIVFKRTLLGVPFDCGDAGACLIFADFPPNGRVITCHWRLVVTYGALVMVGWYFWPLQWGRRLIAWLNASRGHKWPNFIVWKLY